MTEHKIRLMKYRMENLLNRMTANAYKFGIYIEDGEEFGKLLEDNLQLIEDYQLLIASQHARPPNERSE